MRRHRHSKQSETYQLILDFEQDAACLAAMRKAPTMRLEIHQTQNRFTVSIMMEPV
jgi:hypothetical protein